MSSIWLRRIILAAVLLGGIGLIHGVAESVEAKTLAKLPDRAGDVEQATRDRVQKRSDAHAMLASGARLLEKGMASHAQHYLRRASDVDENLRDAAYLWAAAVVRRSGGQLGENQIAEVATALNRAEKVDPLHRPTIELKMAIAEAAGDAALADSLKQRLTLLSP